MARTFLRDAVEQPDIAPLPRGRYRLLTADDLIHQPPPRWLIENFIGQRNFIVLFGPPETAKTFLALHISLSIATGIECLGRRVKKGPILYIAAEGEEGFQERVKAWVQAHPGAPTLAPNAVFLPDSVNLLDSAQVDELVEQVERIEPPPIFVVIDTLARCLVGGDENSSRDIGLAIAAADRLRKALGCTVMVVHHAGKKGNIERGSSALRGGADTMIEIRKTPESMKVVNAKQKNAARFKTIPVATEEISLGELSSSLVIRHMPGTDITAVQKRVILALAGFKGGATFSTLELAIPNRSLRRALRELVSMSLVRKPTAARGGNYQLKEAGRVLAEALPGADVTRAFAAARSQTGQK